MKTRWGGTQLPAEHFLHPLAPALHFCAKSYSPQEVGGGGKMGLGRRGRGGGGGDRHTHTHTHR